MTEYAIVENDVPRRASPGGIRQWVAQQGGGTISRETFLRWDEATRNSFGIYTVEQVYEPHPNYPEFRTYRDDGLVWFADLVQRRFSSVLIDFAEAQARIVDQIVARHLVADERHRADLTVADPAVGYAANRALARQKALAATQANTLLELKAVYDDLDTGWTEPSS